MALPQLGHGALLLAFALALFGIIANVVGERKRIPALTQAGVRAVFGVLILSLVGAAVLVTGLVTHDFSMSYVSNRSSTDMPLRYVITAFYGGQEGSLLFWTIVASLLASIAFLRNYKHFPTIIPYAAAVFLGLQTFLLFMLCFVASPFEINAVVPAEGRGLNPLLRDPGMLVHPPMLLSGYSSFAIPFSIAAGALLAGKMTQSWLRLVRVWAMVAWTILGAGIFLGGWWAYHVLGWGGYWGWDPVENVSLLPWLTATAFIHSIMVQERRGMLKVWNMSLLLASYVMAIFGTFVVRSGLIQSVHSFALSSIGPFFLGFLVVLTLVSIGLIWYRRGLLQSEHTFDAVVSRESGFLLNNVVFTGIAFATFWGTIYPVISEAFTGTAMTVGAPFYNQVNGPLFLIMLVLMGIGPLLAWRQTAIKALMRALTIPLVVAVVAIIGLSLLFGLPKAAAGFGGALFAAAAIAVEYWRGGRLRQKNSGENFAVAALRLARRDPRRYGGYVVHLGVVIIAIGIIASTFFQTERRVVLEPGQSVDVAEYTLVYQGLDQTRTSDAQVFAANIDVLSDGKDRGVMQAKRFFYNGFADQPTTVIAVNTVGFDDVYVMLTNWDANGAANLHIFINPLVTWVWAGGIVYMFGIAVIFWPSPVQRRVTSAVPESRVGGVSRV